MKNGYVKWIALVHFVLFIKVRKRMRLMHRIVDTKTEKTKETPQYQ